MYCCREPNGSDVWWCVSDDDIEDIPPYERANVEHYKEKGHRYFMNEDGTYEREG